MIYIQQFYINEEGRFKPIRSNDTINETLEDAIDIIEDVINEFMSLVLVKEKGSDNLIEIKLIDNQIVKSYILDLFDFEKEFKF